jgi:dTDP-4-amino-4,6-dideoxygalactose transaminase
LKVPLLDLKQQYKDIRDEITTVVDELFRSQQFILGPEVEEFEQRISEYCGCNYAVGVSSGTDALLISLMTAGIGYGDLVITTPYTFFSTAGSIARVGARPIFIDIDHDTYNIDVNRLDSNFTGIKDAEKRKIKAIIPVHLFGQCVAMEPLLAFARSNGLIVIEDAAQAIGAEYRFSNGSVERAGAMGDYGCFSFFPSKNLGAFGDAGMVTTNDESVHKQLKIMREHGSENRYHHSKISGNFRLDALQAAILIVKLKYLDKWTRRRRENANLYRKLLSEDGLEGILPPKEIEERHIYNQFVIRVKNKRDELKAFLNDNGVGCGVYYPVPLHMQDCFGYLGYKAEDFPVSAEAAKYTLALPIFPELSEEQIYYVVDSIRKFYQLA